jgi:hypothetical protein
MGRELQADQLRETVAQLEQQVATATADVQHHLP